jgi:hypothetical protein
MGSAAGAAAANRPAGDYQGGWYRDSYGGDTYPTRTIYKGGYVPDSYYGPTCNPRVDTGCQ